jgi:hypothetical protein
MITEDSVGGSYPIQAATGTLREVAVHIGSGERQIEAG